MASSAKPYETVIKKFLAEVVPDNSRVIDVGCGNGWVGSYLKKQKTGCRVDGVDIDGEKIAKAHGNEGVQSNAISYKQCRAEELTQQFTRESYDFAVSIHSFHHYEDPLEAFKQIEAVLKPGGQLVLCELSPTYGQTLDECKRYSLDEIVSFVSRAGFILESEEEKNPGVFLILAKK